MHKKIVTKNLFALAGTLLSLAVYNAYTETKATAQTKEINACATIIDESLWPEQKKALMQRPKKIVGLVPVRNEEQYIDQCLRALALYTDAIVVLDDASTDNTVAIVESVAQECHIERIIKKQIWFRDEPGDRNKVLQAGREIGGTHFILLDADEMFTAPCLKNNFLRNKILVMEPGERIIFSWICLWKNLSQFQVYEDKNKKTSLELKHFIFCDDGISEYHSEFIHTHRYPTTLCQGKEIGITPIETYGVLHFMAVNWRNMRIKQAWYRCLERIRVPEKSIELINRHYDFRESEQNRCCLHASQSWFAYPFFKPAAYEAPEQWREKQILSWFSQYGKDFFADLDIWDIDWGAGV
ncbi:hypothetical protein CVU75_03410 [Candidatus Dependentiae bacterium HGW-Dependentiae-1]|nr:MAG: hypothetical protein CVU75_03410 [Candidatus Dependentiae bacterium HGW-Dependentiae-1]